MSNCTRPVSRKIQQQVYQACVDLSDALGVCRASTLALCDKSGRSRASVEAALTYLESAGRIHRTTFFIRPGVTYRDIRTFPGYYNFRRRLTYCANRREYELLKEIAEFKPGLDERYTPVRDPFD